MIFDNLFCNNAGLIDEKLQQLDESDNWVSTQYRYDVAGRLTKEIDDQNNETITAYNSLGEVESVTNPDNSSHRMTYNRLGLIKTLTDENNTVTTYNYTAQLLEDFRTISKGAGVQGVDYVDFSYDSFGRLQFAENRQGGAHGTVITKVENVYNAKSLLEAEKQQIGSDPVRTIGFAYDNNLNLSQLTYPSSRVVDYNYDAMNRLKTVVEGDTTYADSNYLGFRIETTTLGNGLTRTFSYGNAGEVTGIFDTKADGSNLLSFEYGYDKVYNRLYEKRAHSVNSTGDAYGYDVLNRLTKARYNVTNSDSYDWQTDSGVDKHDINLDTVHNKTTELRGAEVTTYQSNSLHQYTSISTSSETSSPTYDNAGNTTLYKDFNLSYDYRNRLVKAENTEKRITFTYDVFGRRVQKTLFDKSGENWVESTKTQFVYSGDEVIEEYDYSLSTTNYELAKSYILGERIDQPIALIVEPNATHVTRSTYYYSANAQQSIMALTDENGAIAESYSYDAYGTRSVTLTAGQSPLQEYGYTGRRIDEETGLMYFRARYYSPELGRFISRDPLTFVDGMNLYAGYFAMWGGIDPMGLQSCNPSAGVGLLNPYIQTGSSSTNSDSSSSCCSDSSEDVRKKALDWAEKQAKEGNKDYGLGGEIDDFGSGSWKCNKFVNDAFEKGADVDFPDRTWYSDGPPTANQIADPNFEMKNYPVVKGEPKPGDIVAFPTPGGSGHVAIYAGDGKELQGGKKSASKSSYEEMKKAHNGKVTVRRYSK